MRILSFTTAVVIAMTLVAGVNAKASSGRLKGRVTNSANGVPIRNLTIEVIGQGETTTNQDGKYAFDNLPAGSYKVIIKSSEFDEHRRTVTIHAGQTTISNFQVLPLKAPRPEQNKKPQVEVLRNDNEQIKVNPGLLTGVLSGRVTVPSGQQADFSQTALWISIGENKQRIKDDGAYVFNDLKPGGYRVVLQGYCWLAQRKTVTIRANKTTTLNLRTYCSYG